jgi:hypothetical protein
MPDQRGWVRGRTQGGWDCSSSDPRGWGSLAGSKRVGFGAVFGSKGLGFGSFRGRNQEGRVVGSCLT